jgi:hypothetical protein
MKQRVRVYSHWKIDQCEKIILEIKIKICKDRRI